MKIAYTIFSLRTPVLLLPFVGLAVADCDYDDDWCCEALHFAYVGLIKYARLYRLSMFVRSPTASCFYEEVMQNGQFLIK